MRTVLAYLDAGSASAIVTLILGGIAGIGVALKHRWHQFLVFLHDPQAARGRSRRPPRSRGAEREPVGTARSR